MSWPNTFINLFSSDSDSDSHSSMDEDSHATMDEANTNARQDFDIPRRDDVFMNDEGSSCCTSNTMPDSSEPDSPITMMHYDTPQAQPMLSFAEEMMVSDDTSSCSSTEDMASLPDLTPAATTCTEDMESLQDLTQNDPMTVSSDNKSETVSTTYYIIYRMRY